MRHVKQLSVQRAQTDGEGPTEEEIEDFRILFIFRWIVALVAVGK